MKKMFLIVDDDKAFAKVMASLLAPHGKCVTVTSGEDALLFFQHHFREGRPFDAVFMDIIMPDMDGHETVLRLRALEREMEITPALSFKLVMLSSLTDVKNVTQSFFKGHADAYLSKEKIVEELLPTLKDLKLI